MGTDDQSASQRGPLVNMLNTMMAPGAVASNTAPGINANNTTSFPATIDYQLTFPIKDPVPYPPQNVAGLPGQPLVERTDLVTADRGMFISFPQESVQSRYHMGFIKPNSYIRKPSGSTLNNIPAGGVPTTVGSIGGSTGIRLFGNYNAAPALRTGPTAPIAIQQNENAWALVYNSDLALPRVGSGNGFDISPPLDINYSRVRETAAIMKITSNTISGSTFNLSGSFSSGVIADTRDIAQTGGANGVLQAYPVSSLATQSINRSDVVKNSQVVNGMVDVTGPDFPNRWCQPNIDRTDTLQAEFFNVDTSQLKFTSDIFTNLPRANTNNALLPVQNFTAWITPWDTDFWVAAASSGDHVTPPANHNRIKTDAINEDGILDIHLKFGLYMQGTGGTWHLKDVNLVANGSFMHIFAFVGQDGQVGYNVFSEKIHATMHSSEAQWSIGQTNTSQVGAISIGGVNAEFSFESNPRMDRVAFASETGGKYLGTYISVATNVANDTVAGGPETFTAQFLNPKLTVRARNIDAPGRIGPAHIIRYDDMAKDQVLQMNGIALIQGIAKGSIQPFVQRSATITNLPHAAFMSILDQLFGHSRYFRRICTLKYYNETIVPFLEVMNNNLILDQLENSPVEQALLSRAFGGAAGLFGTIGNLVGGGIDALTGHTGGRGAAIGSAIGGIGDSILGGASGPYAPSNSAASAASKGNAAGMFGVDGNSAGMFAAGSRRGRLLQ